MRKILLGIIICTSIISYSQTKVSGIVTDIKQNPIAFANIIFRNSTEGTISDENGKFYLESKNSFNELDISFMGFHTKTITIEKENFQMQIVLEEDNALLNEVIIYSGKVKRKGNPAIAILKKIWEKKRKNGVYMHDFYEYDKYEKIEFDVNNIDESLKEKRIFKNMKFIFDEIDTSEITGRTYLPFFINEALYKTYGKNSPKRENSILIANNNSGFEKDQKVIEIIKNLYVEFNIYNNYLKFFDKSFTSPLSKTGPFVYNYVLRDSAFIEDKWCYNIVFYPRRKNELTFKGDFWVNDSTFAIKKIEMSATKSANINWVKDIYIAQDFDVLNDSVFLLKRDHMMSDFTQSLFKRDKATGMYGKRTTLYNNYKFDIEQDKKLYSKRNNTFEEEVFSKSDTFWEQNRMETLTKDEKGIYKMLDTLKNVKLFKRTYGIASVLSTGYWQLFNGFDFGSVYATFGKNDIEGFRLQLGGRSYLKHADRFRAQAYITYGFKDEKIKHAYEAKYLIEPKSRLHISAGRRHDVEQTGSSLTTANSVLNRSFTSSSFGARGDNSKLTRIDLTNINLGIDPTTNFEININATYKKMEAALPEKFNISYSDNGNIKNNINQAELAVSLSFFPRRKPIGYGVERSIANSGKHATIFLNYTKGLKGILDSDFDYHKLQLYYEDRLQVGGLGKLKYIVETGKTFNPVPLLLMDVIPGNQSPVMTKRTFDLLDYYEFITDEYASLHLEHNFNGRLFSRIPFLRKLQLREIIGVRGVIGQVSDENRLINASGYPYIAPEKPYWEYHAGIDNIFKLLRVDFIYRGSYFDAPHATKASIKFGINFNF